MSGQSVAVPRQIGIYPMVRLGSVAKVQSGLTLDAGKAVMNPTVSRPYLRVANVQDGWVDLTEIKEVDVPQVIAHRWELRPGDVLMTEGGDADKLGRGTVWRGEIPCCLHQNHIFAVRPGRELHPDYLGFLTQTSYARAYFEATSSKTTGIASTSTSKISSFRIPLPPVQDQVRIAHFLHAGTARIDILITKKRRLAEVVRARRCAWLDQFFAQRGQPYKLKRLLAQSPCYGVLVPEFAEDGVPFVRVNDISTLNNRSRNLIQISSAQSREYKRTVIQSGDVLLSVVGSTDKVAVVGPEMAGANVARAVARLVPAASVQPELLVQWLTTTQYLDQARLATMSDTAQPTLNMGDLANFDVWFPGPVGREAFLQQSRAELARHHRTEILLARQIALLQEHRQALITAAVTGGAADSGARGGLTPGCAVSD